LFDTATKVRESLPLRRGFVAISPIMPIRHATASDLPEIVSIYNASIPGRMATADLAPVSVA